MSWIYLLLAILLEVSGTTCLKLSEGFTKLLPSASMFVFYGMSFWALGFALKFIEVSIAYAIWAGLGTALIAMIGILWFKESVSPVQVVSLLLIVVGVIGLHLGRESVPPLDGGM